MDMPSCPGANFVTLPLQPRGLNFSNDGKHHKYIDDVVML